MNDTGNQSQVKFGHKPTQPVMGNKKETAQYIADMTLELRNLSKALNLATLQGLLEITYYEAFSVANQIEIPPGELEHLKELSRASAG